MPAGAVAGDQPGAAAQAYRSSERHGQPSHRRERRLRGASTLTTSLRGVGWAQEAREPRRTRRGNSHERRCSWVTSSTRSSSTRPSTRSTPSSKPPPLARVLGGDERPRENVRRRRSGDQGGVQSVDDGCAVARHRPHRRGAAQPGRQYRLALGVRRVDLGLADLPSRAARRGHGDHDASSTTRFPAACSARRPTACSSRNAPVATSRTASRT